MCKRKGGQGPTKWIPYCYPEGDKALEKKIVDLLGGSQEEGRYGRLSEYGSSSSTGPDYRYYLLDDNIILKIGSPMDASWMEAHLISETDPQFRWAKMHIGKVIIEETMPEYEPISVLDEIGSGYEKTLFK